MPRTRIATWNIERPKALSYKRRPALESSIRDVDADIWILTETHTSISPGADYVAISSSGSDRPQAPGESWVTIWSRLSVVAMPSTSDAVRTACAVVRPKHGPALIVYGTVLPWLGSPWREITAADGQAFAAALEGQRQDWSRLRGQFPKADLCVAGDMNQDLQAKHHYGSAANRRALQNALATEGLTCVTGGEADPIARMTGNAWAAIDHICLGGSSAISVSKTGAWPDANAPDKALSDHFGLWADIAHG